MVRLPLMLAALLMVPLAAGPAAAKNQGTRGVAKVRVVHDFFSTDVPQPAKIEVRIGKAADPSANPVKITVSYGDVSRVSRIKAGENTVGIYPAGSTTSPLLTQPLTLRGGDRKTIFLYAASPAGAFTATVLDEKLRKSKRGQTSLRVINGIADAEADGARFGVVGKGCVSDPLSYGQTAVVSVTPARKATLAVFPAADTTCSGSPIQGLSTDAAFRSRALQTAVAQVKPGSSTTFSLDVVRDF